MKENTEKKSEDDALTSVVQVQVTPDSPSSQAPPSYSPPASCNDASTLDPNLSVGLPTISRSVYCDCGRAKVNLACNLRKCRGCCSKSSKMCNVTQHQMAKVVSSSIPFVEDIEKAMAQKKILWVRYDGGANPGSVRAILPVSWKNKPFNIEAICQTTKITKTYFCQRFIDCRESFFSNNM